VQALFDYGFSKFIRVRLAQRGQPVSPAPGRAAAFQAATDADALVRLDQLDKVRLTVPPAAATGPTSASFTSAGQPLVKVRLTPVPVGGAAPTSTLTPSPTTSNGAAAPVPTPTGPAGLAPGTGGPGTGGPVGTTLTGGAAVRAWPVPPGAPTPSIDPFLRRDPP
jgi:hypothetical protein